MRRNGRRCAAKAHIKKYPTGRMDSVSVRRTGRDEHYSRTAGAPALMPGRPERSIIVNLHLYKTAGTTLRDSLSRNYGADHLDLIKDRYWGSEDLAAALDRHGDAVAVSRHRIRFAGIDDTDRYVFFPVFFLREPVEWLTSIYAFNRYKHITEEVDDQPTVMARTSSDMGEFVRVLDSEGRSIMSEYIEGTLLTRPDGSVLDMGEFMSGIGRYQIGTVERYDESCVIIEENLRRYFPGIDLSYPKRRNARPAAAPGRSGADRARAAGPRLADAIAGANADTAGMYRMIDKELDARISGMRGFESMMKNFEHRCWISRRLRRYAALPDAW